MTSTIAPSALKLFSVCAFALALTACNAPSGTTTSGTGGGSTPTTGQGRGVVVGLVFDKGGLGDKSFNDSADRGLEAAKTKLGVQGKTVDTKSESDYESNLEAMADSGANLVIGVGISMKDAVDAAAKKYPKVKFAIVDAPVDEPNVRSLVFKEEEGSYLAGYVAGMASKSGKIGFVGGMDLPLIRKFQFGYQAGAFSANPKVTALPAKFTGDWVNVDLGKTSANLLYGDGADVVYAAAGRAGLGVISAAAESKKLAIGVDSDQDDIQKGSVLTSMVKHVDNAVEKTIEDLVNNKFTAGSQVYDYQSGGVDITEMKYTHDLLTDAQRAKLDAVKKDLAAGKIKVPTTQEEYDAFIKQPQAP